MSAQHDDGGAAAPPGRRRTTRARLLAELAGGLACAAWALAASQGGGLARLDWVRLGGYLAGWSATGVGSLLVLAGGLALLRRPGSVGGVGGGAGAERPGDRGEPDP